MSIEIFSSGRSDWPAWTQAIGSILAILVAVAFPTVLALIERHRFRRAGLGLAREVVVAIDTVCIYAGVGQREERPAAEVERDSLELTIDALSTYMRAFPVDRLGDAEAVKAFVRLSGLAANAVSLAKAIQGAGGDRGTLGRLQDHARARLVELEARLK